MNTETRTPIGYSDATGETVYDPADLNYRATDWCDVCRTRAEGVMYHAAGATGRVCAVLFICDPCDAPQQEDQA